MWRFIGLGLLLLTLLPTLFFDLCFAIGTIGRDWMWRANNGIENLVDRKQSKT